MNWKGKVIWITGASSGIGEALVHELSKRKCKIILSARREKELKRVAHESLLDNDNSFILPLDLGQPESYAGAIEKILRQFGGIDIVVHCGGVSQRSEAIDTPDEMERQLMEVNYFAPVRLSKALLPLFIRQQSGHIVVVSSIAGKFGFYLRSSYSAAKHALHGYFESLRLEIESKGIRVLIVCPGKIKTNISLTALTADGKTHNQMDQSHVNAMSAEECAHIILKGIEKNKEEILIGGKELKAVWLKRYVPKLFSKIIRKQSPY